MWVLCFSVLLQHQNMGAISILMEFARKCKGFFALADLRRKRARLCLQQRAKWMKFGKTKKVKCSTNPVWLICCAFFMELFQFRFYTE